MNTTAATQTVTPPPGLVVPGAGRPAPGSPDSTSSPAPAALTLPAADAIILVDPPATATQDGFRVGNLLAL